MNTRQLFRRALIIHLVLSFHIHGFCSVAPAEKQLENTDKRAVGGKGDAAPSVAQAAALTHLKSLAPAVQVDFDPIVGSPKFVSARNGFLSGPSGAGKAVSPSAVLAFVGDPHGPTKAFINEHRNLFGFGPEVLAQASISREFQAAHNGLHTVVWQQQLNGIQLFEAVLISHTTKHGELVNVCSQFVPDPVAAAERGTPNRAMQAAAPSISAGQAVVVAAQSVGDKTDASNLVASQTPNDTSAAGPDQRQQFAGAGLKVKAEARLVWLPMSKDVLRLCWQVVFTSKSRGEMFLVIVDAQSGESLVRHSLTAYLTPATYNVYPSDSPSPFSPGPSTPVTTQPPLVSRTLVTTAALDTNASPSGWLDDGGNETRGNNVDAHTDRNSDDSPDLPRPQGSPFRVFDFPMDLSTQDPTNYSAAAVVQLFYLCNWMHDKLYQLGFTEAAGNFQSNNFGRGGAGNDAVAADAQDGGGTDNANFSTPPDGLPGRMQMYLFGGPSPRRDGDFDSEVVLHEYTHGLSNRRVGGGIGIGQLQPSGMGEGWSDFYALSLLSEPGDDINGNYAAGAYVTFHLGGSADEQNYYFGIRRYPYTTDMSKNPLTFKDIDPGQAAYCSSGAPYHTAMFGSCSTANAAEVHNQGEVWCVTLWEARARLINKYGWTNGNQLILQLVTDGMNLSPGNPTFLQARDAIIQADQVATGGANRNDLWAAFAKRGMGFSATSPASSTTTGVHEAFDLPDDLRITPSSTFVSRGPVGGPFTPASQVYSLANAGSNGIPWSLSNTSALLDFSATSGILNPGSADSVTGSIAAAAASLPMGVYVATTLFTNIASSVVSSRQFSLLVGLPDFFTQTFDSTPNDLAFQVFTFTPDGSSSYYSACRQNTASFPTDPAGGTSLALTDDSFAQIGLSGGNTVAIYNTRASVFFIGSNGYITMNSGDNAYVYSLNTHFNRPRVSALFRDLNPGAGGTVSWKQLADRVALTFQSVPNYGSASQVNSFQLELFFDGRIRLSYLVVGAVDGLTGLSAGTGVPAGFDQSDLTSYGACSPLSLVLPGSAAENAGVLANAGAVLLASPLATNLVVALTSSVPNRLTVPLTATIPAGQVSNAFDLTLIDNPVHDGDQAVTITASAPGFSNASAAFLVIDDDLLPVISQQPIGQVVLSGASATFSVLASGGGSLAWQWKQNGSNIAGATTSAFTINPVSDASGGDYTVGVSNVAGGVLSSRARLTVLAGSSPVDFILSGNYVSLPVATNGQFLSRVLSQGGRFNSAGTGGTNGIDFWLPGNPVYEYCLAVNSNLCLNGSFHVLTVTNLSVAGLLHASIQGTLPGPALFTRDVAFGVNDKAIRIVDTIQNIGAGAISNVAALDCTDPDQGRNGTASATYSTLNDVVGILSPSDAVVAIAPNDNLTIVLGSESGFEIPSAVGFDNTNAYAFLSIVDPNGALADIAINLAANYGTFAPGQSKTSVWHMVFGSSINEATNLYASVARIVIPPPTIQAFGIPSNKFVVRFPTASGQTYYLESKDSLPDGTWIPVRTNVGDGTTVSITNIVTGSPQQFFRLRIQ